MFACIYMKCTTERLTFKFIHALCRQINALSDRRAKLLTYVSGERLHPVTPARYLFPGVAYAAKIRVIYIDGR